MRKLTVTVELCYRKAVEFELPDDQYEDFMTDDTNRIEDKLTHEAFAQLHDEIEEANGYDHVGYAYYSDYAIDDDGYEVEASSEEKAIELINTMFAEGKLVLTPCVEEDYSFNKREKEFIEDMRDAVYSVPHFLEMQHFDTWGDNDELNPEYCGWYVCDYNGSESYPYYEEPLITDEEIERYKVDVSKCFKEIDCYVCG